MWRFLIVLVVIGICAGFYLWTFYDSNVINIIELYTGMGVIFSSIGAIATVFVFRSTAQATKKNKESVDIASKALQLSIENREIENFHQELSYMLSDCEKGYDDVLTCISNFTGNTLISSKPMSFLNWRMDNEAVISKIINYKEILIYARVISSYIYFIDSFELFNDSKKERLVNMIRDKINNDILFVLSVTFYFKCDEFNKEIHLLEKYSFFKRLVFSGEGKNLSFNFYDCFGNDIIQKMESFIYDIICKDINKSLQNNLCIPNYDFYFSIFSSFYVNLLVKMKSYYLDYLISRIEENINKFDVESIMKKFKNTHKEDTEYYFYQVSEYIEDGFGGYFGTCLSNEPIVKYKLSELISIIKKDKLNQDEFNKKIKVDDYDFVIVTSFKKESERIKSNIKFSTLYQHSLNVIHNDAFNEIKKNEVNYSSKIKNILVEKINSSDMCQNSGLSFFFDEDEDKIKCLPITI